MNLQVRQLILGGSSLLMPRVKSTLNQAISIATAKGKLSKDHSLYTPPLWPFETISGLAVSHKGSQGPRINRPFNEALRPQPTKL